MTRDQSPLKAWLGMFRAAEQASSTPALPMAASRPMAVIEALEGRTLLSATIVNPGGPNMPAPTPTPTPPVTVGAKGYGVTLDLKAGQAFDGYLGDLVGGSMLSGFQLGASINWGDGTPSSAGVASVNTTGNIDVSGAHTYAKGGQYTISIGVTATPAPTGPVNEPIILFLGNIQSRALVTSSGGVTIDQKAGTAFTATVGTFSYIAPATNLHASINWGDGSAASAGTITSTGVSGLDVINFKVAGSHKYAKTGTYPIVVAVTQGSAGSKTPVKLITTIDSTAIVAAAGLDLDGTLTVHDSPVTTPITVGALYILSGTGTALALGPVSVSGRIQLPPFLSSGPVSGTLTLTSVGTTPNSPKGSVTLTLAGPTQKGSDPLPGALTYTIASGTGDFAGATGIGTIDITLSSESLEFTLVIHSD